MSSIYGAGFTKRLPDGIVYHTIKNKTVDILCTMCCSLFAFIKQNINLQKKKYLSPKSYMHFLMQDKIVDNLNQSIAVLKAGLF